MWYWDTKYGKCVKFRFHCDGNDNRFSSYEECHAQCSKNTDPNHEWDKDVDVENDMKKVGATSTVVGQT